MTGKVKPQVKVEPKAEPKVEPKTEPNTLPLVRSASAAPVMKVQPMMKVEPQIKTEPQTLPLYGSVYIKPKDFNVPDKPKTPTPFTNTSNASFNTSGSSINTSTSSFNTSTSSFNTTGSSFNTSGSSINTSGLETSSYMPPCNCFPDPSQEIDSGPYYTHLGIASSLVQLRQIMEDRCQVKGLALRIEKAKYCRREGKSSLGCPIGELSKILN